MNARERHQLFRIAVLCDRFAECLDTRAEAFIASRPKLWVHYSWDPCPKPKKANQLQFDVTKNLLKKELDRWLGVDELDQATRRAEEIFNG